MEIFKPIYELYNIEQPNGFSTEDIDRIKSIFGSLPITLIDYYRELANYDFNYVEDFLLRAEDYEKEWFKNSDYLILYSENQGCNLWVLKREDLDEYNPPVYNLVEGNCTIECNTLTEFLEAMAYLQSIWCLKYPNEGFYQLDSDEDIAFVRENFKNKNVRLQTYIGGTEFYGDHPDDILVMIGETSLFYASNSEEYRRALYQKLKEGLGR